MSYFKDKIMDKEFDLATGSLRVEMILNKKFREFSQGEGSEENAVDEHEHRNQSLGYAINEAVGDLA